MGCRKQSAGSWLYPAQVAAGRWRPLLPAAAGRVEWVLRGCSQLTSRGKRPRRSWSWRRRWSWRLRTRHRVPLPRQRCRPGTGWSRSLHLGHRRARVCMNSSKAHQLPALGGTTASASITATVGPCPPGQASHILSYTHTAHVLSIWRDARWPHAPKARARMLTSWCRASAQPTRVRTRRRCPHAPRPRRWPGPGSCWRSPARPGHRRVHI